MNKQKMTIALCVLAVILLFSVFVFTGIIDIEKDKEDITNPESNGYDVTEYCEKISAQSMSTQNPILSTSVDGVFYSCTTGGEVKFYTVSDNGFSEVKATDSAKITVKLSEQSITARVYMYTKDGKTAGYGLYTTAISGDTESIYKYAFFTLRNIPSSMGYSTQYLLLIDTTEDDFRNEIKTYEETFTVSKSDYSTSRYFSEANRYVGLDGTKRKDYAFLTDFLVDNASGDTLFISGRHYEEGAGKFDLMKAGGSGNNIDNILVEKNVICNYAKRTDKGIIYLSENDDGNVVVMNSEKDEPVYKFECKKDNIIVSDNYIYFVDSNTVYSIDENNVYTFDNDKLDDFKADLLVCKNGKIFARGFIDSKYPAVFVCDIKSGENNVYVNIQFKNLINPVILADGSFVYTIVSTQNETESFKATVLKQ